MKYATPTGTICRVPVPPMDHSNMDSLEERLRKLLLVLWKRCALPAGESQLFRDQARGDGRSLGLKRIQRGLLAMAKDCPEAGHLIAAEIDRWTDERIPRPMGVRHWEGER